MTATAHETEAGVTWQDILSVLVGRGCACEVQDVAEELGVIDHALDGPIAEMIGLGYADVYL